MEGFVGMLMATGCGDHEACQVVVMSLGPGALRGAARLGGRFGNSIRGLATAGRAANILGRGALSGAPEAQGWARVLGGRLAAACGPGHSFAAGTAVALAGEGSVAIEDLRVGDRVDAWNEATGRVESRVVTAVHVNSDPVTGTVVIDGERIETTPHHPFLTVERGWVDAEDLRPGDRVRSIDGSAGVVGSTAWTGGPATMYDLTVEVAHTYFVGSGEWLVHNTDCDEIAAAIQAYLGGGEIKPIVVKDALPVLGPYRPNGELVPEAWGYHSVVVKDGLVYDEFVWGVPLDKWKAFWEYPNAINFGF